MSWVLLSDQTLLTDQNAEGIDKFFEAFQGVLRREAGNDVAIIERLAEGAADNLSFVPQQYRAMIKRVAEKLLDLGVGTKLGTMRTAIGKVAKRGDGAAVDILWPHDEWTLGVPLPANLPIEFKVSAAAGLKFAVATDDGRTAPVGSTLAQLTFNGEMQANFDATVPLATLVGFEGKAEAKAKRRLVYFLAYDEDLTTWRAVADGFSRIRRLDDFNATLSGFSLPAPKLPNDSDTQAARALSAISLSGGDDLMVRAGATLRIPLANYGTLRGRAGGRITLGNGFTLRISERAAKQGPNARPAVLVVEAVTQHNFDKEGEVGIGYGFGISDLSSEASQTLLNAIVSSRDILKKVDGVLGEKESFLKPGTLLKGFLAEQFEQHASEDGGVASALRIVFGDALGVDADGDVDQLSRHVGDWLGSLLDNAANLFGPSLSEKVRSVLKPLTENVSATVKGKIDEIADAAGERLEEHLSRAQLEIDDQIHDAINDLLGKRSADVLSDLRQFLNIAREKLSEVARGIEASNLDLIAGEIAWSMGGGHGKTTSFGAEIDATGRDFYRSVIWRPSTGAGRLIDSATDNNIPTLPGVTPLEAKDEQSRRRLRGRTWNVGLIDTPFSKDDLFGVEGRRRRFAEAKVERTLSGVSVGKESWNKARRETSRLFAEGPARQIEFADAISFVHAGGDDDDEGDPGVVTARLSLAFTHEEPNFGPNEIRRFANAFKEAGLVGEEAADALIALRQKATTPDDPKPEANARALLAVPSDHAVDVISFVANSRLQARATINEVLAQEPFRGADLGERAATTLLNYFHMLDRCRHRMMILDKNAPADRREGLRKDLIENSLRAFAQLGDGGWLKTGGLISIALGSPKQQLLALFACVSALTAAATGHRPGLVLSFTAKGETTKFVVTSGGN